MRKMKRIYALILIFVLVLNLALSESGINAYATEGVAGGEEFGDTSFSEYDEEESEDDEESDEEDEDGEEKEPEYETTVIEIIQTSGEKSVIGSFDDLDKETLSQIIDTDSTIENIVLPEKLEVTVNKEQKVRTITLTRKKEIKREKTDKKKKKDKTSDAAEDASSAASSLEEDAEEASSAVSSSIEDAKEAASAVSSDADKEEAASASSTEENKDAAVTGSTIDKENTVTDNASAVSSAEKTEDSNKAASEATVAAEAAPALVPEAATESPALQTLEATPAPAPEAAPESTETNTEAVVPGEVPAEAVEAAPEVTENIENVEVPEAIEAVFEENSEGNGEAGASETSEEPSVENIDSEPVPGADDPENEIVSTVIKINGEETTELTLEDIDLSDGEVEEETEIVTETVKDTITDIKWKVDKEKSDKEEFTAAEGGLTFVFVPEISEELKLSDDVVLPFITVTVKEDQVPFEQSVVVDGVTIKVTADAGVFPKGATLSATKVAASEESKVEDAIDKERTDDKKVAASYTFDIKIFDKNGEEIQPDTEKGGVKVSFALREVKNDNLDVDVYHIDDESFDAEKLDTAKEAQDTVAAQTDGFSYYTVEFTYGDLEYVLQGDENIDLNEVLNYVGLSGTVESVSVSNSELFSVDPWNGGWLVVTKQPFDTEEWMKVTIDGTEFEIKVTDANSSFAQSGDNGKVGFNIGYNGFNVYGRDSYGSEIRTTYGNGGYKTLMDVNGSQVYFGSFSYGQRYTANDVTGYVAAELAGSSVLVKYTVINNSGSSKTVKIGSSADVQIGSNDSAPVSMSGNGITMADGSNRFYVVPAGADFTTRWYGGYYGAYSNIFNNLGDSNTYSGDSGCAWSWTLQLGAYETKTVTAVLAAGQVTTYTINYDGNGADSGYMGPSTVISGGGAVIASNAFVKEGYELLGWSADPNAEIATYSDGESIDVSSNMTLYAVWRMITPQEITAGDITMDYGTTALIEAVASGEGTLSYTVTEGRDVISVDAASGEITTLKVGTAQVRIYASSVPGFTEAEKFINVTVNKIAASIRGVEANDFIYDGYEHPLIKGNIQTVGGPAVFALGEADAEPTAEAYSSEIPTSVNAGSYHVWYKVFSNENYNGVDAQCISVTAGPRTITVKADSFEKNANEPDPEFTVTYIGCDADDVEGQVGFEVSREEGEKAGTYLIKPEGEELQGNYLVKYEYGALIINKVPVTYTLPKINEGLVYNGTEQALVQAASTQDGVVYYAVSDSAETEPDESAYVDYVSEAKDAGEYYIWYKIKGDENHTDIDSAYVVANIYRAQVTVKADNKSKEYGKEDPELSAAIIGLVDGDTQDMISFTLSRAEGEDVGEYEITPEGEAVQGNYEVTFVNGSLEIKEADDEVKEPVGRSGLVYNGEGQALVEAGSALHGTMMYALGKDDENVPKDSAFSELVPAAANAGDYYVWYRVTPDKFYKEKKDAECITVRIDRKPIEDAYIALEDGKFVYDGTEQSVNVKAVYLGGDILDASDYEIRGNIAAKDADTYIVSVYGLKNYIGIAETSWTISRKPISIQANNFTKNFGEKDPILLATITGLEGEDGADVLRFALTREKGEDVGKYAITASGEMMQGNYMVSYKKGVFTINKVTADLVIPVAKTDLKYSSLEPDKTQQLVEEGSSTGGTLYYAFVKDIETQPGELEFTQEVPAAIEAGNYTVYYYVEGDDNHFGVGNSSNPAGCLSVGIASEETVGVHGRVLQHDETTPVSGATVYLKSGNREIASAITSSKGVYNFAAEEGKYNIVVEWEVDGTTYTKTEFVDIENENIRDIIMPEGKVKSILEVKDGTPAVVVSGLDAEAKSVKEAAKDDDVTVVMSVEAKSVGMADGTIQISSLASKQVLDFFDIKVEKQTRLGNSLIPNTSNVLEIIVPYRFSSKRGVKVYRYHGSVAQELAESGSKEDGTFSVDREGGCIYIYTSQFSTYAIGYTPVYSMGGNISLGSYTGSASVALTDMDTGSLVYGEKIYFENGHGSISLSELNQGTYNMTVDWFEGQNNSLSMPFTVQ